MSLKRVIFVNYLSQIYVTVVGIVLVPIYIKYMGAEAYGLVGFFTMLQAWFALLDIGLTPTISRETARYKAGAMDGVQFRQLFRSLSLVFGAVAVLGGALLWGLSDLFATRWLNVKDLLVTDVLVAVQIMAVSVALRWMGGLYRGVITGSERLVWMSSFNAFVATLRFVGVLGAMWVYGFTPFVFFIHQLGVAIIELTGLFVMSRRLLPALGITDPPIGWSVSPIKPLLKFALSIAFTSSVWVMVTQTDKLVLSGLLPLAEYGYFTLAVLVAGGITIVCGPISSAIMPRMARLYAEGKHEEMIKVYKDATKLVCVIAGAAAITIVICAEPLLYAWTGNRSLAEKSAPILKLYAMGNGFLAIGAFPYYMQYAKGNLRYHLIGNVLMLFILLPGIVFSAAQFGAVGAGYAWLGVNAIYLLGWVGYVHRKLEPGLHVRWLFGDVIAVLVPTILVAMLISTYPFSVVGRGGCLMYVLSIGVVAFSSGLLSLDRVQKRIFGYFVDVGK